MTRPSISKQLLQCKDDLKKLRILNKFQDKNIFISSENIGNNVGEFERQLSYLESNEHSTHSVISPIVKYAYILNQAKSLSEQTISHKDEFNVALLLKDQLSFLSKELNLPKDYYKIDTIGNAIIVRENKGEHVILPTHFEMGAYLNHPHAEHYLESPAEMLPRLQIGKYTRFGKHVGINAGGNVSIGNAVWFAPFSYLLTQDHDPYGKPSIASRCAGMTRLPEVRINDYAWIGRRAILGWKVNYVGKASIVGVNSFVNSWVGDYSIVGNYGKILSYLPYKAYLIDIVGAGLEDILRISNWERVNESWKHLFDKYQEKYNNRFLLPKIANIIEQFSGMKDKRMLEVNPNYGDHLLFAAQHQFKTDGISKNKDTFPFILQRAQDKKLFNIRLRNEHNISSLLNFHKYLKDNKLSSNHLGYQIIIDIENSPETSSEKLLTIIKKYKLLLNLGGVLLLGISGDYNFSNIINKINNLGYSLKEEFSDSNKFSNKFSILHLENNNK